MGGDPAGRMSATPIKSASVLLPASTAGGQPIFADLATAGGGRNAFQMSYSGVPGAGLAIGGAAPRGAIAGVFTGGALAGGAPAVIS